MATARTKPEVAPEVETAEEARPDLKPVIDEATATNAVNVQVLPGGNAVRVDN